MANRGKEPKRRLSAGTVFMLALLVLVLGGSALVLLRLSSGASVDLSKLHMSFLDLQPSQPPAEDEPVKAAAGTGEQEGGTAATLPPEKNDNTQAGSGSGSFTLTFAGSVSLSGELRKNSVSQDAKVYDYSDVMMLIAPKIRADACVVFTENLYCDSYKANDTVAPESAAGLLQEAGFTVAACGFSQAYAQGADGIETTLMAFSERSILPVGLRYADDSGLPETAAPGGVRTAFLQYTDTVPAKTRKNMEKDGTSGMIPEADPEQIARDISTARERGASVVIVMLNWGKNGKDPDSRQRELASAIAKAGADLIVGCGSHVPQSAEYLTGSDGKQVLCVWSLGSLLTGDRSNTKHLSGYLLHVTVRSSGGSRAEILNPEYTPVYTWKYRQDSRYYYRVVDASGQAPDGMDNEQMKNRNKAAETVSNVLKGSPLAPGGQTDAP